MSRTWASAPRREPWLKISAKTKEVPPRPWLPGQLRKAGYDMKTVANLTYIVVEEIVGDRVGLSLCGWPDADPEGRLRFPLATLERVGVDRGDLHELVARRHGKTADVDIRIGDAFAAEVIHPIEPGARPETWMKEPLEITAEARKLSKLAFFAATTSVIEKDDAKRWSMLSLEG